MSIIPWLPLLIVFVNGKWTGFTNRFLYSALWIVVCSFSFVHCVVYPSLIYGLWLPLWYLQTFLCPFSFGHCVFYPSLIYGLWLPLWYLLAIVLSIPLWFTDSDYPFGVFKLFFLPNVQQITRDRVTRKSYI